MFRDNEWRANVPTKLWDEHKRDPKIWQEIVEARQLLINAALKWRNDAIADGWTCSPTYNKESMDRAFTLDHPSGFKAMGIARPADKDSMGEGVINVWGPDGMTVSSGRTYDFKKLQAGLRICSVCRTTDVDTVRVGFANRVCNTCLPEAVKRLEYPGWCD